MEARDVTRETVHVVSADEYQAKIVCDFSVPSNRLAGEIGRALADEYWNEHPGCAIKIQFADYTYIRLDFSRLDWRKAHHEPECHARRRSARR